MLEENHISEHIYSSAEILWNYLRMKHSLQKSDVAIAMGSHDLRVASYAAQLVLEGLAPFLICSGGYGRLTRNLWHKSEAACFAAAAVEKGLSRNKIFIEDRSTNTGENLLFSKSLCLEHGILTRRILLVHKPYMERRVWAAAQKIWSGPQIIVTSPPIPFKAYPTENIPLTEVIHIMVGDFQRILVYPEKGFAVSQPVPEEVMGAYDLLVLKGFSQHLIKC